MVPLGSLGLAGAPPSANKIRGFAANTKDEMRKAKRNMEMRNAAVENEIGKCQDADCKLRG